MGAASQALVCAALGFPDAIVARVPAIVRPRGELQVALRGVPGVRVYPSQANFVLVRVPRDASDVAARLPGDCVIVRDVSRMPGLERCLRITVGDEDAKRLPHQDLNTSIVSVLRE